MNKKCIIFALGAACLCAIAADPSNGLMFQLDFRSSDSIITSGSVGNALNYSGAETTTASEQGGANDENKVHVAEVDCVCPIYPWQTNKVLSLRLPQANYYAESNGSMVNYVNPVALDFANAAVFSDTQTVYFRFKWDGPVETNSNYTGWMILNGYDWSAVGSDGTAGVGWGFGVAPKKNSSPVIGRFCYMIPNGSATVNWDDDLNGIEVGKWYDLFVTVEPNPDNLNLSRFRITLVREPLMKDDKSWQVPTMRNITARPEFKRLSFSDSHRTLRIGAETSSVRYYDANVNYGTYSKGFRGNIARMMIWNRALNDDEKWEVMADAYGVDWKLGVANGSADEFSNVDTVEEAWSPSMSWSCAPRALTSVNPTLAIRTAIPSKDLHMGKILHIKPLISAGAHSLVEVAVNGESIGTFDLAVSGNRAVFISPEKWCNGADGTALIEIKRIAPFDGSLELDSVALCGGWKMQGEMTSEGCVLSKHYIGQTDHRTLQRATSVSTSWSKSYVGIHAYIPEEALPLFRYSLSVNIQGGNNDAQQHSFWVNGRQFASFDSAAKGESLSGTVPSGLLQSGDNLFVISNSTPKTAESKWTRYSCYQIGIKRLYGFAIHLR